ncbi:MAG TPA: NBR1-Ig-like domain-containing protein [Anaerolineaceae bacterium]|nr:NBR1-Ig-like domain-containing protein [Anaerolineaceae bacterium]
MIHQRSFHSLIAALLIACFLSACTGQSPTPNGNPEGFYRPPTLVASSTAARATAPPPSLPTPTPPCVDNLAFQSDLSIPDGTQVDPGADLVKKWSVRNSGTCNWDSRYRIRLIAGPELGAAKDQALFPARSGSEAAIQMEFKAPSDPGSYRSAWQAHSPSGEPFGDPFFIEIVVR